MQLLSRFYSLLTLSGVSVMLLTLSGCVTTGLTQTQCQQGDWRQIGYQDGLMGRSPAFIGQHAQRCQASHVLPNPSEWEAGRKDGLQKYCTPLRAYQLGREGYRFDNALCPPEQNVELLKANDDGLYNYDRQQSVQAGFGWGYAGFGGYDPFWGSHWNGWGGYGVPVIEPVYVPVREPHFRHDPFRHSGDGKFLRK